MKNILRCFNTLNIIAELSPGKLYGATNVGHNLKTFVILSNNRTSFFLIYCVCHCVYLHAGIYLLKHRTE